MGMDKGMDTEVNRDLPRGVMFAAYTVPTLRRVVQSEDGAYLDTLRLGRPPGRGVVLCHGFGGNKNIRDFVALAQDLSLEYTVYTFDFRGHGLSPGRSTFGYREVLDLKAVVEMAREDGNEALAALGFSMGGVVVIRYAALYRGLDSAIVVSAPADLRTCRAPGARLIRALMGNPVGRAIAGARYGVKVDASWKKQETPAQVAHLVAPQPLTIIHGEDDYVFEVEQAYELQKAAGDHCRLKTFRPFGHAEQGYGPEFLAYVLEVLREDLR
ncbi:MAG: alpha/beta fold hydrolase [Actinobacteria bacterium]|nr:alpha/beta fold hydrolase [Actinomycetota bacterium]